MDKQLLNPLRLSATMAAHALHQLLIIRTFSEAQVLLLAKKFGSCTTAVAAAENRINVSVNLLC